MKTFTVRHAVVPSEYIKNRIVFNPNYGGGACSVPGTCVVPLIERAMKPKFFAALKADVASNGFRNPIVLYAVDAKLLLSFGGSRLRVAKQLNLPVPAIIVDYDGFYEAETLVTPSNYATLFEDTPALFEFTETGVVTHYSLERARRDSYDPKGMAWTEELDDTEFLEEEFSWLTER